MGVRFCWECAKYYDEDTGEAVACDGSGADAESSDAERSGDPSVAGDELLAEAVTLLRELLEQVKEINATLPFV